MKQTRRAEFETAIAERWQGKAESLDFPDTLLSLQDFGVLTQALMELVRQQQFGALFSFYPEDHPLFIDHPDHNVVGRAVQWVGALSDVEHLDHDSHTPSLAFRPELYYWTVDRRLATHKLKLKHKGRVRIKYLLKYYPSQFQAANRSTYQKIFTKVFGRKGDHQLEYYRQIR